MPSQTDFCNSCILLTIDFNFSIYVERETTEIIALYKEITKIAIDFKMQSIFLENRKENVKFLFV